LSDNYVRVDLAPDRPPNQIIDVHIGSLTPTGVSEHSPFHLL
jgi:hypothetical protein